MAVTLDGSVTAGAVDGAAAAAAAVDPPQTLRIRIRQHRSNCSSGCSISHINLAAKLGQKAMRLLMIATRILLTAIIVVLVLTTGLVLVCPELGDDSVVTPPHININSSVQHQRQLPTYQQHHHQQPQKKLAPFVGPFRFVGADGGRDSTVFLPSGGRDDVSATAVVVERRSFEPVLLEPALPMDRVSYAKLVLGRSKRSVLLGVTAHADADRLSPTNPQDDDLAVLLGNFEDTAVQDADGDRAADEECVDGEHCEAEPVVAEDEGVEEDESSRKKSERGRKRRNKSDKADGKKQQKKHKDKVKNKGKGKSKAEEKDLRRQRKDRGRQDRRHHHQHHEEAVGRLRPIYQHGRFDFGSGTYTLRFDPKSATVAVKRQSDGRVFTTQPHHHHFLQQEEQQQQWRFVLVARPAKHIHLIEDVEEADKF